MKAQTYIVKIEMPDGDMISPEWLKDLIQSDCDIEDSGRQIVSVREITEFQGLDEAADNYIGHSHEIDEGAAISAQRNAFKAGAKWMAEQGVTIKKTLRFSIAILAALLIFPVAMLMSYICDKVEPFVGLTISAILLSVCFTFLFYKLLKSEKAFQTIGLSKSDRWIAYLEKQKEPHYTKRNELFDKCVENCDPEIMKEVSDVIDKELQKEQKPEEWSDGDEGMINCNNKQEQPEVDLEKEETVSYLKAYLDGDIEVGNIVSLRQLIQSAIRIIEGMKKSAADRDEHGNDLS